MSYLSSIKFLIQLKDFPIRFISITTVADLVIPVPVKSGSVPKILGRQL